VQLLVLLLLLLLLLALALLPMVLLLCCPCAQQRALRQQHLPLLLNPVAYSADMQDRLLPLYSLSNSRCWLGPGAQPGCTAQQKLQILLLAVAAAAVVAALLLLMPLLLLALLLQQPLQLHRAMHLLCLLGTCPLPRRPLLLQSDSRSWRPAGAQPGHQVLMLLCAEGSASNSAAAVAAAVADVSLFHPLQHHLYQ
jgi:hypothetical protein